jgi:hypothetical protein
MTLKWTITEINAVDSVIKSVKYYVEMAENGNSVDSEGYWYFDDKQLSDNLTEEEVIEWVRQATMKDGKNMVEARLAEQLSNLAKSVNLPWKPATFKLPV